jgi:hypothetical protein
MSRCFAALCLGALLCGCAAVEVKPVTDERQDGLRFYQGDPYVFVTIDTVVQAKVIWLPNRTREYALRGKGWIGAAKISATLMDGWNLTQLNTETDTKAPEVLTALLAPLAPSGDKSAMRAERPEVRLYRIVFDPEKGVVTRLESVDWP